MTYTDDRPTVEDRPLQLPAHLEHFRLRVLYEALLEGTAAHWRRRAETFAAVGNPRCDEIATACRNHAALITTTGLDAESLAVMQDILGHPARADAS